MHVEPVHVLTTDEIPARTAVLPDLPETVTGADMNQQAATALHVVSVTGNLMATALKITA